jgi:NADPH:quinone reductase-like Zn-dependent oxidoreductase
MFAAVSLSAQKPLVWTELEPQRLGSQDVRVAVQAVGVNPVDWKMREGGPLRMVQRLTGRA